MLNLSEASREDMPERFISLLDKVERCIDFESKDPPNWIQVYGRNNTLYSITELENFVDLSDDNASSQVNHVLAAISCNQNVTAFGYVFGGMKVDVPNSEEINADDIETQEDLRKVVQKHGVDSIAQVIAAGYETRETVYQAYAECHMPVDAEFGEPSLGEWQYGKFTASEMRDQGPGAYGGLRGFFVAGESLKEFFRELAQ